MTRIDIARCVIAIASAAKRGDNEAAHSLEDKLFRDVLTAIARSENDQGELAREALKARELRFARWMS